MSTRQRMAVLLQHRVVAARGQLTAIAERTGLRRPFELTQRLARQTDELSLRAARAMQNRMASERASVAAVAARLEALSPLRVLSRGYSVTQNAEGEVVYMAKDVQPGDDITTRLDQGKIVSTVADVQYD